GGPAAAARARLEGRLRPGARGGGAEPGHVGDRAARAGDDAAHGRARPARGRSEDRGGRRRRGLDVRALEPEDVPRDGTAPHVSLRWRYLGRRWIVSRGQAGAPEGPSPRARHGGARAGGGARRRDLAARAAVLGVRRRPRRGPRVAAAAPARARRARQEPLDGRERPPPPRLPDHALGPRGADGATTRVARVLARGRGSARMTYLDELAAELSRVGIRGRAQARILAETADHLAEGDEAQFGDPRELAQLFADELATQATTRAAFLSFAALGAAGAAFALGWVVMIVGGSADITSAAFLPAGLVAAFALIACPQISFAAGLLALLRARRLGNIRAAPAAELALLARRTNTALAFGAA